MTGKITRKTYNRILKETEKNSEIVKKLRKLYELNKKNPGKKNDNLIKLICDKELIIAAYGNLQTNSGALSKGVNPEDTVDGFNEELIDQISTDLRNGCYKWKNIKKVEIPKSGKKNKNKKRPLGLPTFSDKIVQEMIRTVLCVIYEPTFQILEVSHGSRPKRSTHTAISRLAQLGQGMSYAIEGDIKSAFPSMNHNILMNILKRRILDLKFLELIQNSLRVSIEFKGKKELNLVGTAQGSIASPILFNIYMNEFDVKVQEIIERKGKENKKEGRKTYARSKRYATITQRIYRNRKHLKEICKMKVFDVEKYKKIRDKIREDKKLQIKTPPRNWKKFVKRIVYCRYVDDWVILINEREKDAVLIKAEITEWLQKELKMELDQKKTHLTNLAKGKAKFLGFTMFKHIQKVHKSEGEGESTEYKRRAGQLLFIGIDHERVKERLINLQIITRKKHYARHVGIYCSLRPWQIVMKYKQKIEGFAEYYYPHISYKSDLSIYYYFMYYSCIKTISHRTRISVSGIIKKYGPELRIPGTIKHKNKHGIKTEKNTTQIFPKYLDLMDRIGNRAVLNRKTKKDELTELEDLFKSQLTFRS
jgi:group II intron reverse transcriptase/maturase